MKIFFFFQAQVTLETSHIGKGCDRDTYNLASQRQLCGASELALDLLPDPDQVKKSQIIFFFQSRHFIFWVPVLITSYFFRLEMNGPKDFKETKVNLRTQAWPNLMVRLESVCRNPFSLLRLFPHISLLLPLG